VGDPWTPSLHLTEAGGRCRLWIGGCTYGDGVTLQEAADDLVHRVLLLAAQLRAAATLRTSTDIPPPDPRLLALLDEVGQIAAHGGDVRERLFGVSPA
jgi:hypothetical protein